MFQHHHQHQTVYSHHLVVQCWELLTWEMNPKNLFRLKQLHFGRCHPEDILPLVHNTHYTFFAFFCATHVEHVDFVLGLGWQFWSIIL